MTKIKPTHPIKIVFFDIDETLFMKNHDFLPDSIIPALKKLQEAGIIVAIATGRVYCSFPYKIHKLIKELNIDAFVTANGQHVEYKGKILRENKISKTIIKDIVTFFDKNHIEYAFINNQTLAVSNPTKKLTNALNPITTNYIIDKVFFENNDVLQLLSFTDESQDQLIEDSKLLKGLKTIRWHQDSLDIFDANGSKAEGIEVLANYLGFNMNNVMAFGDGLNDIEMLTRVGMGVAMGNAQPVVKNSAKYITKSVDEDGIAYFLKKSNLID